MFIILNLKVFSMRDDQLSSKGMPDDEEIIELMEKRIDENLMVGEDWRNWEVRDGFAMFEGTQWTNKAIETQISNAMPQIVINRVSPVFEAICGFEIQNRMDVKYVPRIANAEQRGFSSVCNNMVQYIEQKAKAAQQRSLCFKDMLICGVGATSTCLDYDNNPNGEATIRRVFPAFLFWDITARAKNITDGDYVIEMKIASQDAIAQEYDIKDDGTGDIYASGLDARVLQFFESILTVATLGVVYEYQWREKKPFYRVENPFLDVDVAGMPIEDVMLLKSLAMKLGEQFSFDPTIDKIFSVENSSDLSDLKKVFETFGLELEDSKEYKYKYYRAIVTGGKVIKKSENWSQKGFSIKFMTGQFSELTQSYYGLMRFCKDPQRMLNQSVSDFVGFLQTIPKGGVSIEEDAVSDINAFLDTYARAKDVTIYASGALAGGKVMPKVTPPMPSGILEMIQYADSQIMQVCGVTPELMGMMKSREMNTSFYQKQIQQCLTTLSTYFDAEATYLEQQGVINIDCARILMENNESKFTQNVIGEANRESIELLKGVVAAEYDVIVESTPASPDQNNETFMSLLDLARAMPDKNIMPLALQYSNLPEDVMKQLEAVMQPAPPPQPDPVNQELIMSQARKQNAEAQKMMMEAQQLQIDMQLKMSELQYSSAKQISDIDLTKAKTFSEIRKSHVDKQNLIDKRLNNLTTIHNLNNQENTNVRKPN